MERKIGEIFKVGGDWYQCLESVGCSGCDFYELLNCSKKLNIRGECVDNNRSDGKPVVFKKLEKVGEPMKIHNRLVLKVKADAYKCMRCCFYSKGKCELTMQECEHYDCGEENKFIEIKQNKEDMVEKRLNLKPFDIQKAREGKPVCTRDGRKARIICFDTINEINYPIIALIEGFGYETLCYYNEGGKAHLGNTFDLMMLSEKKEGWVNLYKSDNSNFAAFLGSAYVYNTKEEAINNADPDGTIATVKIEWEG